MRSRWKNTSINKVIVAMSGGVDSSVAAALLKEQGYDPIGVTMTLACVTNSSERSCCSLSAAGDAKKVADLLHIPHYTLNFKDEFKREVIDNFIEEYRNGRTPNPCIRCNQLIKFDLLLRKARELGAEYIATGHYARVVSKPSPWKLLKGKDPRKDQSYVLYRMSQEQLAHTLFPLGEWTKDEVREKARELGLPVAEKEESQEICFVEDDDYVKYLKDNCPDAVKPGPILDKEGGVIGQHDGVAFYTVGQRKGIGAHKGLPKYVVKIDLAKNAVIIGDQEDTLGNELMAEEVSFISGKALAQALDVMAKIRYNSAEAEAIIYPEAVGSRQRARVVFNKPQRAITPGQSVVFFKGEEVLGGGIIS